MEVTHYKLANDYNNEVVFGIFNPKKLKSIEKLNRGFKLVTPWNECVPFYKNTKFAFKSVDALKYFLFKVCSLNEEDVYELKSEGYEIFKMKLSTYSSGLSNFYSTFYDEEVDELKEMPLDMFDDANYYDVPLSSATAEDIEQTTEAYYNNIKTYY